MAQKPHDKGKALAAVQKLERESKVGSKFIIASLGKEMQRPDVRTPTLAYTGECINGIWRFFPSVWSVEAQPRLAQAKAKARGRSGEAEAREGEET